MSSLHTIKVYNFSTFVRTTGVWEQAPYKATRESIAQLGGNVLEGTAESIETTLLDGAGRYRRVPTGWGDLD
jgi:hypothetical protein